MELQSTSVGQHLAQHPYNKVKMLNGGVEVSGARHIYTIPFNQLIEIRCKRGLVWGELEFELPDQKVVRLHGTEWRETQRFYHYLNSVWQQWSDEMSIISAEVLNQQSQRITERLNQQHWLTHEDLEQIQTEIKLTFSAIPLPEARLTEFPSCNAIYESFLSWLESGVERISMFNKVWVETMLTEHHDFFARIESQPLNLAQCRAVITGEKNTLVLASAGSGKTSVIVARAGWLLHRKQVGSDEILLLAFGRKAADEMNERIKLRLKQPDIQVKTFHALALQIIEQCSKKAPVISKLETDALQRRQFLIQQWQQQCSEKKSQAAGWKNWISQDLGWELEDAPFWQNTYLSERLAVRLDYWLGLVRTHGGSQADLIALAPPDLRSDFQKKIRLLSPLLKAWKSELKEQGAVDFSGLLNQAINFIQKGKFVSPWLHILVDEFQDLSPQRAALVNALRHQRPETSLFAVGDDWQSIYRFSGSEQVLTTDFSRIFGSGDRCLLDTTYRFSQSIGDISSRYIQQNPAQLKRTINSVFQGEKNPITILPDTQLEALFNKLSSYVKPDEKILVLGRYHYSRSEILTKVSTRWPKLNIEFMTIHASKGLQADYVIVLGFEGSCDGFPANHSSSVIEQVLLTQTDDFPYAEERRLLYVALTRAKYQVWLMQSIDSPSVFVKQLSDIGVVIKKKP